MGFTIYASGPRKWSCSRDAEGHRTYRIVHRVKGDSLLDGPAGALSTPGLPVPGSFWVIDNDVDLWAWCRFDASVEQVTEQEPFFDVEQVFSTRPPAGNQQRCHDTGVEDPLLEPPKISGDFIKYTEEAVSDRAGRPIVNSAWEQIRGPQVEFDRNRQSITIEQNVATPEQAYILPAQMMDTVNAAPLWGLPARCIKLSSAPWEKRYYGGCFAYYNRKLTFDINVIIDPYTGGYSSGFDREILDEGTKVLHGHWDNPSSSANWILDNIGGVPPSRFNPAHFDQFKDRNGENSRVILNGAGKPIDTKIMGAVENATDTTPIVVTSTAHGLVNGDRIGIIGVRGNTAANGFWTVASVTTDTFELEKDEGVSNGNGAYTGGGLWVLLSEGSGPGRIRVEKYQESDFLLLGIPTTF